MKQIRVCPRCKVRFLAPNKKYFYCDECRVKKWVKLRYEFYLINKNRADKYENYYINELTDRVKKEFKEKGYIESEQILPLPNGYINKDLYINNFSCTDEENEKVFVERLMKRIKKFTHP